MVDKVNRAKGKATEQARHSSPMSCWGMTGPRSGGYTVSGLVTLTVTESDTVSLPQGYLLREWIIAISLLSTLKYYLYGSYLCMD